MSADARVPGATGSRKFTRDSLGLAFTQYIVRAISMLRTFIAARLLDPTGLGAWNALQLMMDYGALAPFGTQQGLDQLVPARLAGSDPEAAKRLKRAALVNILVLTLLFSAAVLAWASAGSSRMRVQWGLGGLAMALVCVLLVNLANVGTSTLRSHGDFAAISHWFVLQGLIGSALGLVLMMWWGRWGLLWGWSLGCLVSWLYVQWRGRRVLPWLPGPSLDCLDLVQVGLPLYLYTASSIIMRNLDRIVVLRFLGTQALGYYGLSVNVLTLLMAVPDSLVYVSYPRFVKGFTEGGPEAIGGQVERLARGMALGIPLAAGLLALLVRDAVHLLLPRYDASVPAMQALAFGATGVALGSLGSVVVMTIGRRMLLVPAAAFLIALSGGMQLLVVRWQGGLDAVAAATAFAYLVSGGVLLTLASAGLGHPPARTVTLVTRCLVPTVVAALLVAGLLRWVMPGGLPRWEMVLHLLFAWVVFAGLYVLIMLPFARGIGFHELSEEMQLPFVRGIVRRLARHGRGGG